EALTGGKVSFSARARYESVEQNNALNDADAYTLRTTLGYKTGDFNGFKGFIEFEDVSDLGDGDFNDTKNGNTAYSVVADPDDTEVNQAYLQYTNFNTDFKLGRQEITYRGAPFHRFIGNVLWRQNHQSFDAFSLTNTSFVDLKLNYAYINKVQTIFGGTDAMDSHLFNAHYSGLPIGTLEGYGYFLEYDDAPKNTSSSKTLGLRLSGAQAVSDDFNVVYTAEFAKQDDYKDGTMDDQNYYLAELGGNYKGWLAKFSYELQEGDGTSSFKTPLGTNHAFQGWADQFLSTPGAGLEDIYFTVSGKVLGAKVVAVYHEFETDQGGIDAGDELDLLVEKAFMKHYTVGVKYADYNAGDLAGKVDTEKFWVYGQVKF
ncbi:MAG: alginate export family protein, partial [Gammaproteobacteria bacterium]|nr:alginate export family protein [Gammaproteobacteria bacterium]